MKNERPWGLPLILILALVLAGYTIVYRVKVESFVKPVEIALDYDDIVEVGKLTNTTPLQLVQRYHQAGMSSLVLVDDRAIEPDPELTAYAKESGLLLIPQLTNQPGLSDYDIAEAIDKVADLPNCSKLIFRGYEAYGYPDNLDVTARALSVEQLPVGIVEFLGEQKGLDKILDQTGYQAIRVHPGYPADTRAEFALAVKDRGIRIVFLKPFKHMDLKQDAAAEVERWVSGVVQDVQGYGFPLGEAQRLPNFSIKPGTLSWIGVGIVSAGVLFLSEALLGLSFRISLLLWALGSVGVVGFNMLRPGSLLLAEGLAWLAAVIFPAWGMVRVGKRLVPLQDGNSAAGAIRLLLEATLITLAGAILANAALTDIRYLLAWRVFRGVKAAFVAPLVLVTIAYLLVWSGKIIQERNWRRLLSWRTLLTFGVAGLLLAIYVMRSGNISAAPVFGIEATLRQWLETVLRARPRTKEFLIGHPALFLAAWAAKDRKRWVLPLLLIATTGQVSIFNTFVHLHTPVMLSLLRTIYGLALGTVVGIALQAIPTKLGIKN